MEPSNGKGTLMKQINMDLVVIVLGGTLLFAGCKKEKSSEQTLQEGFQTPAAQSEAPTEPLPVAAQLNAQSVKTVVDQAAADIKAQNYTAAARRLDAVAATPGITAQQLAAAQNAQVAMEQELMQRARAGDQQALKALHELANRPKYSPGQR